MLSYKLKHLFSRAVASLSAVGLFSLGNSAAQAEGLSGKIATYSYTADPMSFSANYVDLKCETNGQSNLLSGEVYYNASGVAVGCNFICQSGFYVPGVSGATPAMNIVVGYRQMVSDTTSGYVNAERGCVARSIPVNIVDNFKNDLFVEDGEAYHDMTTIFPVYGTSEVHYSVNCAEGLGDMSFCTNDTPSYILDNRTLNADYFANPDLAGYEFAGLMDKDGNTVMGSGLTVDDGFVFGEDFVDGLLGNAGLEFEEDTNLYVILPTMNDSSKVPTLYAKWEPKTITVNFDCDGGTISGAVPSSVTYGSSVTMPSCIMSGKVFDGWAPSDATQGFVSDLVVSPK